ncbi:hypothetical protein BHE74_00035263 [Ensete ventricosum]|nr:hypothetical protein BHE74_00035263 [Ensete ventricosum]
MAGDKCCAHAADSASGDRESEPFIVSVVGPSYLITLLPLRLTMSSYLSTMPLVLTVRRASAIDPTEQELGNWGVAGADPTEQELGNWDVARADPTEQEPGNWNVARADPTEQELGNWDVARADPTEPEPGNWNVARADPTEQELGNLDLGFCQG